MDILGSPNFPEMGRYLTYSYDTPKNLIHCTVKETQKQTRSITQRLKTGLGFSRLLRQAGDTEDVFWT